MCAVWQSVPLIVCTKCKTLEIHTVISANYKHNSANNTTRTANSIFAFCASAIVQSCRSKRDKGMQKFIAFILLIKLMFSLAFYTTSGEKRRQKTTVFISFQLNVFPRFLFCFGRLLAIVSGYVCVRECLCLRVVVDCVQSFQMNSSDSQSLKFQHFFVCSRRWRQLFSQLLFFHFFFFLLFSRFRWLLLFASIVKSMHSRTVAKSRREIPKKWKAKTHRRNAKR